MQQLTRTRKQSQSVVAVVVFKSDLSGLSSYSETDWGPGHLCSISLASDLFQTTPVNFACLFCVICFVCGQVALLGVNVCKMGLSTCSITFAKREREREREREFCGIPRMLVDYELIYTGRDCHPSPFPALPLLPVTLTHARTHARTHAHTHTHTHTQTSQSGKQANSQHQHSNNVQMGLALKQWRKTKKGDTFTHSDATRMKSIPLAVGNHKRFPKTMFVLFCYSITGKALVYRHWVLNES